MAKKRNVIEDFDEFEEEAKMMPDLDRSMRTVVRPRNDLEAYFFDVADKHGVLDQMLDDDYNADEY